MDGVGANTYDSFLIRYNKGRKKMLICDSGIAHRYSLTRYPGG